MQEELDAINENDTYEYVSKPTDVKVLPLMWVYALKQDEYGNVLRFKARLVAQGCRQVEGVDYDETFAPVSTHACTRVVLNLAATEGYHVPLVDVKTAFLNGELEEEVYVALKKALYGLKQAPRAWHKKLTAELEIMGFKPCRSDPGLLERRERVIEFMC